MAATPTRLAPTPRPLPSQHTPVAHHVSQIARRRSETRVHVRWQPGPGRLPRLRSVVAILLTPHLRWARNTFREIKFTAKPTRPRNGQASRRRLACPSANSWVFVGLATGLAVRLNGIGPRPCLTSPGRGSAVLDCGDDRSHVAAVERDRRKLPGSTVPEEHGAHRIWERRVQRAGNHRRRADDTNVTGPLAHARVASGGALIERPRRCGPSDRGQPDRRRGCGHGKWREVAQTH